MSKVLPTTNPKAPAPGTSVDVEGVIARLEWAVPQFWSDGSVQSHGIIVSPKAVKEIATALSSLAAKVDALTKERDEAREATGWRCYWCNTLFTDRAKAEIHFGAAHSERPAPDCLRLAQREAEQYREDYRLACMAADDFKRERDEAREAKDEAIAQMMKANRKLSTIRDETIEECAKFVGCWYDNGFTMVPTTQEKIASALRAKKGT